MNEIISSDLNKFVGVDFHIHTPASHCYKGPKTDGEYIEILRKYVDKKVKVLAITDHNTLKGYRKLKEIEKEYVSKLKYLSELSEKYPDIKTEYDQVKSQLKLFNELLILPGVEFEANPGIHLLLIFNPNFDLNKVESFLIEAGYTEEIQGKENPGIIPKYDVLSVLNEASSLGALVIASHADSNKGIYNSLEKNQYRASVFRSNNLNAISYNNPITCQKMKGILKNKEYKRESPVAFIQCSDYHGSDEVATCITYLKLEELDFESVCNAFKNPNECVSPTQHPKIMNILRQIINDHKSFVFENLESEEDISLIKRAVCAALNDGYGSLVIGAVTNPEINIIGINLGEENSSKILKKIFKCVKPATFSVQITGYEFGENRRVIVVQVARETNTISYIDNNDVYILKNNQIIKANPTLIENIVEDRLFKRMAEHQKVINNRFEYIIREIELLKESSLQLHLLNKIEKNSICLLDLVNIDYVDPFEGDIEISKTNGDATGNVMFVETVETRLNNAYLRISCPKTNEYNVDNFTVKRFKGEAIVLVPGGGTYYVNNNEDWCVLPIKEYLPTVILTIKDSWKDDFSELSLVGWLKSSILIWYCNTVLGSSDIHNPDIFKKIVIPMSDVFKKEELNKYLNEILDFEQKFLSIDFDSVTEKEFDEMASVHNKQIDFIAYEIDKLFFKEFDLTIAEIEMIKKFYDLKEIHNVILAIEEEKAYDLSIVEAACIAEEEQN